MIIIYLFNISSESSFQKDQISISFSTGSAFIRTRLTFSDISSMFGQQSTSARCSVPLSGCTSIPVVAYQYNSCSVPLCDCNAVCCSVLVYHYMLHLQQTSIPVAVCQCTSCSVPVYHTLYTSRVPRHSPSSRSIS